ncbi:hypothetical protein BJ170DRAFT_718703 [Xylariales sp. AK1849]|nr:hypothetical protein BJ170DRAFT_718703 [Xylariales sp. AK1849]
MAPETLSLAGKIAIVTGSGRENGIGAAIALALARNGAAVTLNYVTDSLATRAEKTAQSIRDLGARVALVQADITKPEGATKIVTETLKAFETDHVDILINNAGAGKVSPLLDMTPEQMQSDVAVNIFGPLFMTQAVVLQGKMPHGGRIINIGTVASKMGIQGLAFYAATKAAVDSLTASWAGELGRTHGITVNTLAPGPVQTDIVSDLNREVGRDVTDDFRPATRGGDRLGTVEDIGDAALLLVQEKSRWITAQWITVSGGVVGTMG